MFKLPTYEYKCDACGHAFEKFHSITAMPIKKCPSCGKNKVRRLISAGAGMIFKGSGFYITDYRSDGYKDAAKKADEASKPAETTPAASPASTDSKSTEAKPAPVATAAKPSESAPAASKSASKTGSAKPVKKSK